MCFPPSWGRRTICANALGEEKSCILNGLQEPSLIEFLSYNAESGQLSDHNPHRNTLVGQPHPERGVTVQF